MSGRESGLRAKHPDVCQRCPEDIKKGDRIVFLRGRPIHVRCASGGDDE